MIPRATYRLQFHRGFTFGDGARLAPYLARLGISHLYSSPIQTSRRGSTHGYDVVDHATISAERGGQNGFVEMAEAMRMHGIAIILDIVPNHMFVGDWSNAWWRDILENGRGSRFARHFDIDWDPPDRRLRGKVLLPFLGQPYAETLGSGAFKLTYDRSLGKLVFAYFDHRFPLRGQDCAEILAGASPQDVDLEPLNSIDRLHALLERQNYVLSWWQSAGDRINWRRFFDISELAGIRVEQDDVFEAVHALPLELYARGLVDGFRIDHVDGLADPAGYCRRVRERLTTLDKARPASAPPGPGYLVIEKIPAPGEGIPRDWEVDGTTGYDFLGEISGLQHDPSGAEPLALLWRRLSHRSGNFEQEKRAARLKILDAFEAQTLAVADAFAKAARADTQDRDISTPTLRRAIRALIAELDSYRTSLTGNTTAVLPPHIEHAATHAKSHAAQIERAAIDSIVVALAGCGGTDPSTTTDAARRFNQLASAVAAKAVEDTAFYRHAVLISRNDVGSDPSRFSIAPSAFHAACTRRREISPHTMIATATHDHKRGEDARARLAVLSEIPSRWERAVEEWLEFTASVRPDRVEVSECYHLFQTLVGAWPLSLGIEDGKGLENFRRRILAWRTKSLREAKLKSSWMAIDADYEAAHARFAEAILDPARSPRFLASFQNFMHALAPAGAANGLAQTVLRLTTPGVPDTYQGTEFWDFSLVDPDNRRDVDFPTRQTVLDASSEVSGLLHSWRDGGIKQALIARLLAHRASDPDLFARGTYLPIDVAGPRAGNLVAFARRHENRIVLVGVTRCCAEPLLDGEILTPPPAWWADTRLLAAISQRRFSDVLQPVRKIESAGALVVSELLSNLPCFVLCAEN